MDVCGNCGRTRKQGAVFCTGCGRRFSDDDLQPAKKRRMRAAEARAMKLLREAKAVPEFRLK